MRAVFVLGLMAIGGLAQDSGSLRALHKNWIDQSPMWTADAWTERMSAEGRVRPIAWINDARLPVFGEDGARTIVFQLESATAGALRIHFEDFRLPVGFKLFVYSMDERNQVKRIAGPYEGSGPLDSGEFWSPAIPGSRVVVELQMDREIAALPFTLREIAHLDHMEDSPQPPEKAALEKRISWFRGTPVEHQVVDGMAVAEGDILLGRIEELEPYNGPGKSPQRMGVGIADSASRWPGGIVPYTIDPALPSPQRVTSAIANWNAQLAGSIQIVPRSSQSSYVTFTPAAASTCSSYVGRTGMAAQPVYLGDYCSTGNAIHEIGHALGLYHEHTRNDRDTYVEVLTQNMDPGMAYNFGIVPRGLLLRTYDYGSIMHYGAYAFSNNGQPTIVTKPAGIAIGQRGTLSAGDIGSVEDLYPAETAPSPVGQTVTVNLTSIPGGLQMIVDGVQATSPVARTWQVGSAHTVIAPNIAFRSSRVIFTQWNNGGTQQQTIIVPAATLNLAATYVTEYRVTVSAANNRGTVGIAPASTDGYYAAGSGVTVTAAPNSNACFSGWNGVVSVNDFSLRLTVDKPYAIGASFQSGSVTAPAQVAVGSAAQTANISVSATSGCIWKASTTQNWIALQNASGKSSSVLKANIMGNTAGARSGVVTVNGKNTIVVQAPR